MRARAVAAPAIIAACFALAACGTTTTTPTTTSSPSMSHSMSHEATAMHHGTFSGLNDKHVAGTASIEGSTLTLTGFSTDEGPDLHVYLTNGTDEAAVAAGHQVAKVTAAASQTFDLAGMDTSGYKYVVIHCDKAKAVFGAATLM